MSLDQTTEAKWAHLRGRNSPESAREASRRSSSHQIAGPWFRPRPATAEPFRSLNFAMPRAGLPIIRGLPARAAARQGEPGDGPDVHGTSDGRRERLRPPRVCTLAFAYVPAFAQAPHHTGALRPSGYRSGTTALFCAPRSDRGLQPANCGAGSQFTAPIAD